MQHFPFQTVGNIISGLGSISELKTVLTEKNYKRLLLVTDAGILQHQLHQPILEILEQLQLDYAIYSNVQADPAEQIVLEAVDFAKQKNIDVVLGFGGGSAMDVAKIIAVLSHPEQSQQLSDLYGVGNAQAPRLPLILVPTTAGTGSEVTMVAVVSDTEKNVKMPFASYYLMPHAAILDPRMTQTLPPHLTAMTAMDAMTHAIEAYSCMAANPISDAYATAAIKKISNNLFNVLDNPSDEQGRLELAQASTMAGIAFSNSMVGLVHSLGHALGAVAHLPHGLCMNLFLPYVLEYNKDVNADKIAELLLPLAGADVYAQTPAHLRADKTISTLLAIRDRLYALTKLPRTLQETGKVSEAQLDEVAEKALNDGSIIYNPKEANLEELKAILKKAW